MYTRDSTVAYRAASADTETQVGLLLVSYDALAVYLSHAAEAVDRGDIPARCEASNRALTLLGHVESWIHYLDDPNLSASLSTFYGWLRQRILLCQVSASRAQFDSLAEVVLRLRATWSEKKDGLLASRTPPPAMPANQDTGEERSLLSAAWYA